MKNTMRVWEIETGILRQASRPLSVAGQDEVLIKVSGIGMNRADILQRMGKYPPPHGASDLPGLEISGSRMDTNEQICVLLPGGGYAEYVTAPKALCLPVPGNINVVAAAALPEAMFTVAKNIFILGALKQEEHLLVHGGASGIGTMAIQMAKLKRARVTVTAGSDTRCRQCIDLGADRAINYKKEDFAQVLKDDAVDIVLDMVGGDYPSRACKIMNRHARHVSIAFLNHAQSEISIPLLMQKNLIFTGSTLRGDSVGDKVAIADYVRREFWPYVATGEIRPVIDRILNFDEAPQAHEIFEKTGHFGKILLTI